MQATHVRSFCGKHYTDTCACTDKEQFTFVNLFVFNGHQFESAYGTFRFVNVDARCPSCCSMTCYRDVELSTGEKLLSGYTPSVGEIVRNNWSECRACGWNQAS